MRQYRRLLHTMCQPPSNHCRSIFVRSRLILDYLLVYHKSCCYCFSFFIFLLIFSSLHRIACKLPQEQMLIVLCYMFLLCVMAVCVCLPVALSFHCFFVVVVFVVASFSLLHNIQSGSHLSHKPWFVAAKWTVCMCLCPPSLYMLYVCSVDTWMANYFRFK